MAWFVSRYEDTSARRMLNELFAIMERYQFMVIYWDCVCFNLVIKLPLLSATSLFFPSISHDTAEEQNAKWTYMSPNPIELMPKKSVILSTNKAENRLLLRIVSSLPAYAC